MFKVAEKFVSINGESRRAGELAVFIRFTGCNLSCSYCDTSWACPMDAPNTPMTTTEIVDYIKSTGIDNVTLTGGEPLLQPGIEDLIVDVISTNRRVEVETNGAVSIKSLYELANKLNLTNELSITLDYKCPRSGMMSFMIMENYDYLREYDTVKFVVGNRNDMDRAREVIAKTRLLDKNVAVYLSPIFGEIEPGEIVAYMIEHKMNGVTHQLQQHKIIWDPQRRGA